MKSISRGVGTGLGSLDRGRSLVGRGKDLDQAHRGGAHDFLRRLSRGWRQILRVESASMTQLDIDRRRRHGGALGRRRRCRYRRCFCCVKRDGRPIGSGLRVSRDDTSQKRHANTPNPPHTNPLPKHDRFDTSLVRPREIFIEP